MKFVYPDIDYVFDTECEKVNTLVIENQRLLVRLLTDISALIAGEDGRSVLSAGGKELSFDKNAELLSAFVPFELNQKALISKICAALEKAGTGERFVEANELLGSIEAFLIELSGDFSCDLSFNKISLSSLIKSAGVEINEDYELLGEKIIDYFELVTEFDRKKMFFTVNLRAFIDDDEAGKFIDTVLGHGYNLIMIENCEHKRLNNEQRYIVDSALCEIK